MRVEIGTDIQITGAPGEILRQVMADLTYDNPEYAEAQRRGFSVWGKPRRLRLYQVVPGGLRVPRGYLSRIYTLATSAKDSIIDLRQGADRVDFGSRIAPRDYQREAVTAAMEQDDGVIVAPPGAGKTMIGLEIIARLGRPALWLTHTKDLADQAEARAREHLAGVGEIGRLGDGRWSIGDKLTIGMVQALAGRDLSDITGRFGTVITDECHHLSATTWFQVINQFPACHRYGLTATPKRPDGLEFYLFAGIGPEIYEVSREILAAAGQIIVPEVRLCYTDFRYDANLDGDRLNWNRLMDELTGDHDRNRLVVDTILGAAEGHYSLVLSDRVEHCYTLQRMIGDRDTGLRCEVVHAGLGRRRRREIMAAASAREIDILLATQLAREGLDLPHLDRLHVATPKRAAGAVEQEAGRVARPAPGKDGAVIFDYCDDLVGVLKSQSYARRAVYRKLGCTVPRKGRDVAARQVEQYLSMLGGANQ